MADLIAESTNLCSGCAEGIAMHLISRACPKDVIVSMSTGCLEVCTTPYPFTSWKVPAIHAAFETSSSVASGIEAAVKKLGKDWKVLAIAGDGGTVDIGFGALSGTLERGHKVTHIVLDNECYANTGVQRSGSTPYGAWTTTTPAGRKSIGKSRPKKPVAEIVAAHRIPYVATASIAYPSDLIGKVKKALEMQPSFVHIHAPCNTGWGFEPEKTVEVARKAVETGMWVLYEIEEGAFRITKRIENRKPVEEYLGMQKRFRHLTDKEIRKIQEISDSEQERLERLESMGRFKSRNQL
jgi:pyruvate ferredoxin oxidoreductase beta subunit